MGSNSAPFSTSFDRRISRPLLRLNHLGNCLWRFWWDALFALSQIVVNSRVPLTFIYNLSLFIGIETSLVRFLVLRYLSLACSSCHIHRWLSVFAMLLLESWEIIAFAILLSQSRVVNPLGDKLGALWGRMCSLAISWSLLNHICIHYNAVGFFHCVFLRFVIL